jgi:hypothetical protein
MKTNQKNAVEGSKVETPANSVNENQSLVLVKKKLTVAEKLDKIQSFDSINGKYEYLKECKENLDKFDKAKNDFSGAKIILKEGYNTELTISNPIVIEEIVKISKMRLAEQLIKVEKEIEAFEI